MRFSGHVLVAEDNAINAMVIESLLKTLGLRMTLVGDGRQAVAALTQCPVDAKFDLVLMDLHMPELDGYDATREIRDWEVHGGTARCPIIALTADAFEEDRKQCLAAGMDDFLTKPISIVDLQVTLAHWLPTVSAPTPTFAAVDAAAFAALVQTLTPLLEQNQFDAVGQFNRVKDLVRGTVLEASIQALDLPLHELRFGLVLERLQRAQQLLENQTRNHSS